MLFSFSERTEAKDCPYYEVLAQLLFQEEHYAEASIEVLILRPYISYVTFLRDLVQP